MRALRDEFRALAIDSPCPTHVEEALEAGFDMVLSVSPSNISSILRIAEPSAAYVLIAPRRAGPEEKLRAVKRMISKLEGAGITKIIVDPLLEPPIEPGTMDSLLAYELFRDELGDRPLLMGLCNVLELVDADSPGLAALLTILAGELGVSLLLTTEESRKTRGSTAEVSAAAKMVSLALHERRPPKDVGITLLKLKDKVDRDVRLDESELELSLIHI